MGARADHRPPAQRPEPPRGADAGFGQEAEVLHPVSPRTARWAKLSFRVRRTRAPRDNMPIGNLVWCFQSSLSLSGVGPTAAKELQPGGPVSFTPVLAARR